MKEHGEGRNRRRNRNRGGGVERWPDYAASHGARRRSLWHRFSLARTATSSSRLRSPASSTSLRSCLRSTSLRSRNSISTEIDIDEELAEADAEEVEELELPIALEAARFGLPIFLLVYLLAIAQWTIISAALWTVGSMVLTGVLFPICYDAIVNRTVRHTVVERSRRPVPDS